ncbi:hypothetical protein [Hungatella effluvii]|uniref:hypothetical protein n=1 Tax=Hungatella effluvii TaxID=1096246 RepID=UPI0022E7F050|nr:hypothetical protein [Hungatella effluvii]
MVTGVVVEIIAVIIAADAYATIPVKIIVIIIGIATAAITTIIAASIHVPEKEKKLMRPDLETAVIMPPVGRITVVANDNTKRAVLWGRLTSFHFSDKVQTPFLLAACVHRKEMVVYGDLYTVSS